VFQQIFCTVFSGIYASKVGEDKEVDELFLRLCEEVNNEVLYMTDLMEVQVGSPSQ